MNPGGITETIWYFAGYLQLANELARAGELYESALSSKANRDSTDAGQSPDVGLVENLDVEPVAEVHTLTNPASAIVDASFLQAFLHALAEFAQEAGRNLKIPEADAPKVQITIPGVTFIHNIPITYSDGGDQAFADVEQSNRLSDDDVFGDPDTGIADLQQINIAEALQALMELANAQVPDDFSLPIVASSSLVEAVAARDAAATQEPPVQAEFEPGTYVNGILVAEPPVAADSVPEPVVPAAHNGFGHVNSGLEAELGGNVAYNAAAIADLNELSTSMVVRGDYFESQAVIQTNVYSDHDEVDVAGESDVRDVKTGGNIVDNIATIISTDFEIEGWGRTGKWHVDLVEGDFFDIKSLRQTNWMSDNDTIVQTTTTSYSTMTAGASAQYNVANFYNAAKFYDLIVVHGDYHEANWIYQTNILLDDDIVKVVSNRGDTIAQTVKSGDNELTNEATIEKFGGHDFKAITDDVSDLMDGILSNDVSIAMASELYASARVLDILYVKGDYFDINVVSQINVIADADIAVQWLPEHAQGHGAFKTEDSPASPNGTSIGQQHHYDSTAAYDSETTSEQHVSTGGNITKNVASIVDTGAVSDFQYVGGDHYEEVVLIQTNIVESDDQKVVYGDTTKLASEVIAFTGEDYWEENCEHSTPVKDPGCYDDLMGNVTT